MQNDSPETWAGIDHMAVYTPRLYLEAEDLANARGVDPNKFIEGIGISQIAIPPADEDVVVLAANAGAAVLSESGVSPDDIGLLVVGTESSIDKSKPTATHIHELLGINSSCRVYDIVHACAGGTYGILSALDWLVADNDRGYALVISSDIARYGRNTPGEPTQGAGAVALLLSRTPRLISLKELSTFSRNVYDFWKPLAYDYPVVDGMFSAQCYSEAALACFAGQNLSSAAAFLYHTPYPKLVQQTHMRVARSFSENGDAKAHYESNVAPSHQGVSRIGNTYAASLWFALYGLLDYLANDEAAKSSAPNYDGCYLFSYGSGCGAALLRGQFADRSDEMIHHIALAKILEKRDKISMDLYGEIMDLYEIGKLPAEIPRTAGGKYRLAGVRADKRIYETT